MTAAAAGILSKLSSYMLFLSGYPFGFERLPGMVRYAVGGNKDLPEIWVDTEDKRKNVQVTPTLLSVAKRVTRDRQGQSDGET